MWQDAQYYTLFMAFMILGGGVMGFVKAKSKASLISGIVFGVLLGTDFAFGLSQQVRASLTVAFILYLILDIVFVIRLVKTKKFMPAGMILILCVIGQIWSGLAVTQVPG
ncbi:MAG TPA: TMEM14 family protein [Drouetiella sp.]